jgi:hypothetical protein
MLRVSVLLAVGPLAEGAYGKEDLPVDVYAGDFSVDTISHAR